MEFVFESVIPAPVTDVFAFHERADAFALLQPPFAPAKIIQPPSGLEVGTRVELKTRIAPLIWVHVVAEHVAYEKNVRFEDVMRKGPFASWHHKHLFFEHPEGCRLRDQIELTPPLGWLGRLVAPLAIRPQLRRLFRFRHEVTRRCVLEPMGARPQPDAT